MYAIIIDNNSDGLIVRMTNLRLSQYNYVTYDLIKVHLLAGFLFHVKQSIYISVGCHLEELWSDWEHTSSFDAKLKTQATILCGLYINNLLMKS